MGMKRVNVQDLPVAVNVCEQVLREVEKQSEWSMAHVIMNPFASSLLHDHQKMTELYVITKGYGVLGTWNTEEYGSGTYRQVVAGSVHEIRAHTAHLLYNKSAGHLEHLVFTVPSFLSADVHLLERKRYFAVQMQALQLPEVQDCFDGAKILSYAFPHLDLSIAFGWVITDPTRWKQPHYHGKITECIYVVSGEGFIDINRIRQPIRSGDWIRIDPGTEHGLFNESPEDLVICACCYPMFSMEDVYQRRR